MIVKFPSNIIIERPEEENAETIQDRLSKIPGFKSIRTFIHSKSNFVNVSKVDAYMKKQRTSIQESSTSSICPLQNILILNNVNTIVEENSHRIFEELNHGIIKQSNKSETNNHSIIQYGKNCFSDCKNSTNIKSQNDIITTPNVNNYIHYNECFNYYSSLYFSKEREMKEDYNKKKKKGCCFWLYRNMFKKYTLNKELEKQKKIILFISNVVFSPQKDEIQIKIINTINNFFLFDKENNANNHLNILNELIEIPNGSITKGFVFSIIMLLSLIERFPNFIINLYNHFTDKALIPYLMVKICLVCISLLNKDKFNIYFNQRKGVLCVIDSFYLGMLYMFNNIISASKLKVEQKEFIDITVDQIENETNKCPREILWKETLLKDEFQEIKNSMNISNVSVELYK